ncbi:MAG: TetR family transcriptional regulator C-terminal domain-containing protein [Pseudomonadota bacterium]
MNIEAPIKPNRRRKAPKEERRRQLIDAAIKTIAEKGISGTTTSDVTRAAGLSAGIVSLHFGGKDGLLTETLRFLATELRDVWVEAYEDPARSADDKLRAVVEGMFDPRVCTPDKIAAWFAYFGEAKYRAVYRELVDDFDNERTDAIEALCAQLKDEGGYHSVDPEALSISLESLADGFWLSLALYPDWKSPSNFMQSVFDLLAAHFPKHFKAQIADCGAS